MTGKGKIGLVLEGGGMRSLFSAGIIDVMMEHSIAVDALVGVSAGVAFGCNYKSGQIGRALRYNVRFATDKRYSGWGSLLKTGNYFNAEFCYHRVPNHYDRFDAAAYEANPMLCYAVCTDIDTCQPVYHLCEKGDDETFEWIRASASMPVAALPVEIGGQRLLDGGLTDSLPLRFMQEQGYSRNIVVLTRERGYEKSPLRGAWLMRLLLRKYPQVVRLLQERPAMYNEQLRYIQEQEAQGNTLVLAPEESLDIKRTCSDAVQMHRVYEIGRRLAQHRLADIRAFVSAE